MKAEAVELSVDVEIEEGAVSGGRDAGFQNPRIRRNAAVGTVVRISLDIRGGRDVKDVNVPVDGEGGIRTVPGVGVSGENEELAILDVEDLGLRGDLWVLGRLGRGVVVEGEGDDEFPCVAR